MIRLRPASTDDLPQVVDVFWSCWTTSYRSFADAATLGRLSRADAEALWRDALGIGRGHTTLAVDEAGRVVGVLRHEVRDDELWVHSLYVSPDAQGSGTGGRLLQRALQAGATAGAHAARLWVFAANADSLGFYRRHGWAPDGRQRVEQRFGLPEIGLSHDLPGANPLQPVADALAGGLGCEPGQAPPRALAVGVFDADAGPRFALAGHDGSGRTPALETRWDVASVTKLVTAVVCLGLVSDGQLDLDEPVDRWLPELAGRGITPALLLQHRAGLRPWQPLYGAVATPTHSRLGWADAALASIAALPHEPVGVERYSDLGLTSLGVLLTRLTGRPLPDLVDRWVNDPLGTDLRYGPVGEPVATSAPDDRVEKAMVETGRPYPVEMPAGDVAWATEPLHGVVHDSNARRALGGVSAHAGLFASLPDLLTLGAALADADTRPDLWGPPALARIVGEPLGLRTRVLAGAGVREPGDGSTLREHPGFTGCALGFVPGGRRAFALVSNRLMADGDPATTEGLWSAFLNQVGDL